MENDRFILNRNSDVKVIYIGTGQFQLASGKWVDAILYKYNGVYKMMEASEFIRLAEQDKSTTLDTLLTLIQIKKNIIYLKQKSISRDGQKVIIDNSRGLRLGFFIELAEYFIFFIFKLLCVHKDEKQIFCICMKTRNSNNCLPRLEFRI